LKQKGKKQKIFWYQDFCMDKIIKPKQTKQNQEDGGGVNRGS